MSLQRLPFRHSAKIDGRELDANFDHLSLNMPFYNARDYGALGDGSTDDASKIQTALNAINSAGGGTLFFHEGTYIVGTKLTVYSNTTLLGESYGSVTLKAKASFGDRLVVNQARDGVGTDTHINFENIIFDMNGSNQSGSTAVTIARVDGHKVTHCEFKSPYDSLYLLTGADDVNDNSECYYTDVFFNGAGQSQATDVVNLGNAENVRMFNCRAKDAKTGSGQVIFSVAAINSFVVSDCYFDGNDNGCPISIFGVRGGKLDGCEIMNSVEGGVRLQRWTEGVPDKEFQGFEVVNCNIHDNAWAGIWVREELAITDIPFDIKISSCDIWNNGRSAVNVGVVNGLKITNCDIYNNSTASAGTYAVFNLDGAYSATQHIKNVRISGNRIYDTQGTPSQTFLYNLDWVDRFISQNNTYSQITTASTSTNSTNVYILDGNDPILPVAGGGTASGTALNNNRVIVSSGSAIVEAAAITASRALASDANGIPVASAVTATELGYVSGVTSAIQTQLNAKGTGDVSYANTRFYLGSLSRDTSAASDSVAYTGVGFAPKAVLFFGAVAGTTKVSWGMSNASTDQAIARVGSNYDTYSSQAIVSFDSAGNETNGQLTSLDSDGFTISWTKTGAPSGTMTVFYMAFR